MKFTVVIPARYDSSRLHGKVLLDIAGKTMLQHTYEKAIASGAERVIIATDDARVAEAAGQFAEHIRMTSSEHPSGSSRAAEIVEQLKLADDEIVVTVQADEPMIPPANIRQVAENLANDVAPVATLAEPIVDTAEIDNPNIVKVVCDANQHALYFSREPIPHKRADSNIEANYLRHIGLYAYRAGFLIQYAAWPASPLEQLESLEQLRILYHGERIHVALAKQPTPVGVDTQADLEAVRLCVSTEE